jgi:hypothetical protein
MNQPSLTADARPLRRGLGLAMAVVVAVLAVTSVAAGVAEAAPPPLSLSATPNPVTIPLGQTTGHYDLSWSTGSNLPAEFTFQVDNGPVFAFNQVPAGTAANAPIDFGHTHTWKLYTKGLTRPLKTIVVTTRRPDQSCLGTCLKDVKITPHGTFADVKVIATAKLKTFELTAHKAGESVSSAMIGWDTQTWNTQLLSLEPGTAYEWDLKVRDESGNSQVKSGSFTTLKRQVTVSFDSITVTDDSDDLSEGDLLFWFNVGDWDHPNPFAAGIDTGDTVNPGYSRTVVGAPDTLKLGLNGWDDDCGPLTLCSMGVGPGGVDGGSNSEADWATAWTDVNTSVSGPGESFSATFSLATSAWPLQFSGSGTYSVTYI